MKGRLRTLALLLMGLMPGFAMAELTNNWWGSWAQVVAEGDLGFLDSNLKPFRLWLEGQSRWNQDWRNWYQGVARIALGYSLSDRATLWMGYSYVPTKIGPETYLGQQDVWPAFRYVLPTEIGTITFRTMLEANFIRGDDPRFHIRQMIRFMHSLSAEPRLSLILWDELLLRGNSTLYGGSSGFGQNRAFLGAGWSFSPLIRVELGYMNQFIDGLDHRTQIMQNLVMGSVFINF